MWALQKVGEVGGIQSEAVSIMTEELVDSETSWKIETIEVPQFIYDLALQYKATRDRLELPEGVLGVLLGSFPELEPEHIFKEGEEGFLFIYHNKKFYRRQRGNLAEDIRVLCGYHFFVVAVEDRPYLRNTRIRPWHMRTIFRTILQSAGKVESD